MRRHVAVHGVHEARGQVPLAELVRDRFSSTQVLTNSRVPSTPGDVTRHVGARDQAQLPEAAVEETLQVPQLRRRPGSRRRMIRVEQHHVIDPLADSRELPRHFQRDDATARVAAKQIRALWLDAPDRLEIQIRPSPRSSSPAAAAPSTPRASRPNTGCSGRRALRRSRGS